MSRLIRSKLFTVSTIPFFTTVNAESENKTTKVKSRKIKPSELSIYDEPEEVFNFEYQCDEKGVVEEGIGMIRNEVEGAYEATLSLREQTSHIFNTGIAHTAGTIDYLQDEENILPRVGVITFGGLAGLLLGARKKGGFFKKLIYSSAGLGATASLCYPKEAAVVGQEVSNYAEVYGTVAYNFIAGVKPTNNGDSGEAKPAADEEKTKPAESAEPSPPAESAPTETSQQDQPKTEEPKVEGDHGMSNPEDNDMYTTRGN